MKQVLIALGVLGLAACGGARLSGDSCHVDGECPLYQSCTGGRCISGCATASDCSKGQTCSVHGRCVAPAAGRDGGADGFITRANDAGTIGDFSDMSVALDMSMSVADMSPRVDAWICTGGCPDTAIEPNNNAAQAHAVTLPYASGSFGLAICPRDDIDLYKVQPTLNHAIFAVLDEGPCGSQVSVDILAADATTVIGASVSTATGANASATVTNSGVVYVRVQAQTPGGQNFYTLHITQS